MKKLTLTDKRGTSKVMELLLIKAPKKLNPKIIKSILNGQRYVVDCENYDKALIQSIQEGVPFHDVKISQGSISKDWDVYFVGADLWITLEQDELYDVPEGYKADTGFHCELGFKCLCEFPKDHGKQCEHFYAILTPITKEEICADIRVNGGIKSPDCCQNPESCSNIPKEQGAGDDYPVSENSIIDKALNDAFVAGKSKQSFESFKKEWYEINKPQTAI